MSNFNEKEIDAIGEIMNISMGASATAVSNMLGAEVHITTPVVKVMSRDKFEFKKLQPAVGVEIAYDQGLFGKNVVMFSREDVRVIVSILMGMDIPVEDFVLDEMNRSAICEVMNQMMGASATSLSEFLGRTINITTPVSFEIDNEVDFREKYFTEDEMEKVIVSFDLEIKDKVKSEFLNIMSLDFVRELLAPIMESSPELLSLDTPANIGREEEKTTSQDEAPSGGDKTLDQDAINAMLNESQAQTEPSGGDKTLNQDAINAMLNESQAQTEPSGGGKTLDQDAINAMLRQESAKAPKSDQIDMQPSGGNEKQLLGLIAQLQASQLQMMNAMTEMKQEAQMASSEPSRDPRVIESLKEKTFSEKMTSGHDVPANREMLLNVPLDISVEIGRTKRNVREILELTNGSLVVLDKMAGEQADLFVNGKCIARGDIVVVEDNFGIRITEILSRQIPEREDL